MKKFAILVGVLLLALVFTTACNNNGDGGTPTVTPATPPPATPTPATPTPATPAPEVPADVAPTAWTPFEISGNVTIRMAWWGGDARHDAVNAALDIFESRYPHVTIVRDYGAFAGYQTALTTQLAAQAEADVLQSNYAWIHAFDAGRNVFLNLRDYDHIIDLSEWAPALLDFGTTADGQLSAVPHGMTGRVIIYNQELLAEHGATSFPATFDEWIELGDRIAAGNATLDAGANTYAFFPLGPESLDIVLLTMLYNETGRNLQANGRILHTVDEVEAMFNILARMIANGTIPTWEQQEAPHDATNPVWMQGRGGSVFEWVANIFLAGGNFRDNNPAARQVEGLGLALLPAVTPGGSQSIMQRPSIVHAVSRNSQHPELAVYLLNFLYTDEEALLTIGAQFGIPLSRTAAAISEREGQVWGLQTEGLSMLLENVGEMCFMFEDPNLRPERFAAIEGFRTGALTARQAAERWVNGQQNELSMMG
jgi:oligogalacturonide transport system substrate-binding protein